MRAVLLITGRSKGLLLLLLLLLILLLLLLLLLLLQSALQPLVGFWPALRFCSTTFYVQFLTFIFFRSSSTWSSHLSLSLPTGHDEHGSHSVSFLTVLVVSIRFTCATQRNLCDFINLTFFYLASLIIHLFLSSMSHRCLVLVCVFF